MFLLILDRRFGHIFSSRDGFQTRPHGKFPYANRMSYGISEKKPPGGKIKMERNDISEQKNHKHRGKFSEGLLSSKAILKALNIKAGQIVLGAGGRTLLYADFSK